MIFLKYIYFYSFACLFLLLLLLGESYLSAYVQLGFLLLFFVVRRQYDWERLNRYKSLVFSFFLFFTCFMIAIVFSHSIPLSFEMLNTYVFVFLFVIHLLIIKKSYMSTDEYVTLFLLIGAVLGILSLILFFIPTWGNNLPGVNVVFSTYGHNHLAAFLIMLLPLSFVKAIRTREKIFIALFFFFVFLIAISYGRTALFLSVIEVVVMLAFVIKKKEVGKKFVFLTAMSGILLCFALCFLIFFSIFPERCLWESLRNKVCKSFQTEARTMYWRQAKNALQDFPVFGYGPGTFILISQKYKTEPYLLSAFAHNTYIQMFAEGGIVVGVTYLIFVLILFTTFVLALWRQRKKESMFLLSLFLAVTASYLNALIDFDWSFKGIFLLTLSLIILGLRENFNPGKKTDVKISRLVVAKTFSILTVFFFGFQFLFSLSFVIGELLIKLQFEEYVAQYPFFPEQLPLLLKASKTAKFSRKRINNWYVNHAEIYKIPELDEVSLDKMIEIDPLSLLMYYSPSDSPQVEQLCQKFTIDSFDRFQQTAHQMNYQKWSVLLDHCHEAISQKVLMRATEKYSQGDIEQAKRDVIRVSQNEPSLLMAVDPPFVKIALPKDQEYQFVTILEDIKDVELGKYRDTYAEKYFDLSLQMADDLSTERIKSIITLTLHVAPWREKNVSKGLSGYFNAKILAAKKNQDDDKRQQLIDQQTEITRFFKETSHSQ